MSATMKPSQCSDGSAGNNGASCTATGQGDEKYACSATEEEQEVRIPETDLAGPSGNALPFPCRSLLAKIHLYTLLVVRHSQILRSGCHAYFGAAHPRARSRSCGVAGFATAFVRSTRIPMPTRLLVRCIILRCIILCSYSMTLRISIDGVSGRSLRSVQPVRHQLAFICAVLVTGTRTHPYTTVCGAQYDSCVLRVALPGSSGRFLRFFRLGPYQSALVPLCNCRLGTFLWCISSWLRCMSLLP
jgi:hypothetical protein